MENVAFKDLEVGALFERNGLRFMKTDSNCCETCTYNAVCVTKYGDFFYFYREEMVCDIGVNMFDIMKEI